MSSLGKHSKISETAADSKQSAQRRSFGPKAAVGESPPQPLSFTTRKEHKPQTPPRLAKLTPEQIAELVGWLSEENATYKIVVARLKQRFGITLSQSRLCRWYQRLVAKDVTVQPEFEPLLDVTIDFRGVPLRIQLSAPAGANIQPKAVT